MLELIGTLVFAYSGLVVARRKEMDFIGSYSAAFLSAFGGGTLRDLLLDRHPLYWIAHPEQLVIVFVVCVIGSLLLRHMPIRVDGAVLQLADALGLGVFSAAGAALALQSGAPALPAILMGVLTATAGGVLRDVICAEVPQVFRRRSQLYVTCTFTGAALLVVLRIFGVEADAAAAACVVATVLFRLAAIRFDLQLPF
ncbi:MAG: trimeric intracellular cation channel family protein [Chloroflexi bacterium]|nr:trimeric intracellular cation channel family protein [Chloroflexota bacterium]